MQNTIHNHIFRRSEVTSNNGNEHIRMHVPQSLDGYADEHSETSATLLGGETSAERDSYLLTSALAIALGATMLITSCQTSYPT